MNLRKFGTGLLLILAARLIVLFAWLFLAGCGGSMRRVPMPPAPSVQSLKH